MIVVLLKYRVPYEEIEPYVEPHLTFLDDGYKNGYFIASGPQCVGSQWTFKGGVILSRLKDKEKLESVLKQDPFWSKGLAEFTFIEFEATKHIPELLPFV